MPKEIPTEREVGGAATTDMVDRALIVQPARAGPGDEKFQSLGPISFQVSGEAIMTPELKYEPQCSGEKSRPAI